MNKRRGDEVKIEHANFKAIEAELYGYQDTKKDLELIEEDIIESSPFQEVSVQSGTSGDSTANKAIKLSSSKELLEVRRRVNAIERALEILQKDQIKLRLLQMKYFERKYTDSGIMNELHIGNNTFYRWRREIVKLVGSILGWKI
jgi:RinA family phage transcriptional activator